MKILKVLIIVLMCSSCTQEVDQEIILSQYEEDIDVLRAQNHQFENKIDNLKQEYEDLSVKYEESLINTQTILETNKMYENKIVSLEYRLSEQNINVVDLLEDPILLDNVYHETELPGLAEFMEIQSEYVELKVLPYENSIGFKCDGKGGLVQVLAHVINAKGQEWVYCRDIFYHQIPVMFQQVIYP